MLAWSSEEAGKILEIFHVFGPDRAGDIARGVIGYSNSGGGLEQWFAQAKDAICTIQGGVGPKDATTLLHHFGSIRKLVLANKDELTSVPAIGVKKSSHLHDVFNATWSASPGGCDDDH